MNLYIKLHGIDNAEKIREKEIIAEQDRKDFIRLELEDFKGKQNLDMGTGTGKKNMKLRKA